MAKQEKSSMYVNVKIEQSEVIDSEMLFESYDDGTVELLSKLIDDASTDDDKKAKYLHRRILISYKKKKWIDVINDIEMFEQINNSDIFTCIKIKASLQEYCRNARLIIMNKISNLDYTNEDEKLFLNISQYNVDKLINGSLSNKKKQIIKTKENFFISFYGYNYYKYDIL